MVNCRYYYKEEPKESRCQTDSSIGYCIVEKYNVFCKVIKKRVNPLEGC